MTPRRPTARALRSALVLVPVAPLLALAGLGSSPAQADPAPYVPADGPHHVTAEFRYTGAPESFTVPAGVTSLEVTAVGASGGSATPNDGSGLTALGGRGSAVSTSLDVVPGTVYSVNVGGRGGNSGDGGGAAGWNGGGAGGEADRVGAGGGGATDLRGCAPEASGCDSLASRIVVAAGGGGAAFGYDDVTTGADAGAAGATYTNVRGTVDGGQPGTATAGGAGGAAGDESDRISRGGDGTLGSGGVGGGRTGPDYAPGGFTQAYAGAGGGGGGLHGGGGGGDNRYYGAPGGGGSSLVPAGGVPGLADPDADGVLRLGYDLGPVTRVDVEAATTQLPASGRAATDVTITPRTEAGVPIAGLTMKIDSNDPGQSLDPITDHGDGTYTSVLHGSTTVGTATLVVTVAADGDNPTGQVTVETVAYTAPGIRATSTSSRAKHGGWYRTPVTVSFACTGTRLSEPCPPRVVLSSSGRRQVVTRTLHDDQGRSATSTTTVSIDRALPKVSVGGARNGATYTAKRKLTCRATDTLSGVASCKVTTRSRKAGRSTVVTWTGTAHDRAGNRATTTGRYTVRPR